MRTLVRHPQPVRRARLLALGALALAALTFLSPPPSAGASSIGVSPSTLTFDNALRSGTYQASIAVFTDSSTPSTFSFQKEGDVSSWLSFFDANDPNRAPVESVVAPPQGTDGFLGVKVDVPAGTTNGTYTGSITVYSDVNKGASTAGPVNVGAQVGVTVNVTGTQTISGDVVDASLGSSQIEVGQPARFAAQIKNTGNVDLQPDVAVVVRAKGSDVDVLSAVTQAIRPADIGKLIATWDTHRFEVGDYTAKITAKAGAVSIGERTINFRLVPEGTLRRNGELRDLKVTTPPSVGGAARVVAEFANTGEIDAEATFRGELWRDGKLVGDVASPALLVDPGSLGELSFTVPTPERGDYKVTGLVNFSGKETSSRDLTFKAGDSGGGGFAPFILVAAAGVSIIGIAIWLLRRRPGPPSMDGPPARPRVEATV